MLWVLFFVSVAISYGTEEFESLKGFWDECKRKNNNGKCDLKCRNVFNGAEISDCSNLTLSSFNKTLHFRFGLMDVPSSPFLEQMMESAEELRKLIGSSDPREGWTKELERRMREASEVEVKLNITHEQLLTVGNRAVNILNNFLNTNTDISDIPPSNLSFIFTIPVCEGCPNSSVVISKLAGKLPTYWDGHMQYVAVWPKSTSPETEKVTLSSHLILIFQPLLTSGIIALIVTVVALLAACALIIFVSRCDTKSSTNEEGNRINEIRECRIPVPRIEDVSASSSSQKPFNQTASKTAVYGKADQEETVSLNWEPTCSLNKPD